MKEAYPNFEGQTINGELVPTKKVIRKMSNGQYRIANPFAKKCCADCVWVVGYRSWWCKNDKATKARGTHVAGVVFCPFWEPDWSEIPYKYKIPEYGYVPSVIVKKTKSWWSKFLNFLT